MIRSSQHTLKFSNISKRDNLSIFRKEYILATKAFVNYIWNNGYSWKDKDNNIQEFNIKDNKLDLPSMLTSDIIEKSNLDTILTGRALKCCLTQIAGLINASVEKQRKRLYMLDKFKKEGKTKKKLDKLIKKIKQNIPQKPNCDRVNIELNSICCSYQKIDSKEFDGFLRLTSITKTKLDIKIPIKHTGHSKKMSSRGTLKASFLIRNNSVDFRWEIPDMPKKQNGITVGADQGMLDVLNMSDRQITPKQDIHGHSLSSILDKLCRKKKNSIAFGKAQDHRKNFINWSINSLDFSNICKVNLERIWNIGYKNPTSKKMSHWTNTLIRDKVESICEQNGVQLVHQSSTYRSQRCSECGIVRKSNRKGKVYTCDNCGLIEDADYNASKNHEISLPEIPYDFRNLNMNKKGFFWLESGLFSLDGRSLQSLL